jgi:hypothetical protein
MAREEPSAAESRRLDARVRVEPTPAADDRAEAVEAPVDGGGATMLVTEGPGVPQTSQ